MIGECFLWSVRRVVDKGFLATGERMFLELPLPFTLGGVPTLLWGGDEGMHFSQLILGETVCTACLMTTVEQTLHERTCE